MPWLCMPSKVEQWRFRKDSPEMVWFTMDQRVVQKWGIRRGQHHVEDEGKCQLTLHGNYCSAVIPACMLFICR